VLKRGCGGAISIAGGSGDGSRGEVSKVVKVEGVKRGREVEEIRNTFIEKCKAG
jgi:hypothetical protein